MFVPCNDLVRQSTESIPTPEESRRVRLFQSTAVVALASVNRRVLQFTDDICEVSDKILLPQSIDRDVALSIAYNNRQSNLVEPLAAFNCLFDQSILELPLEPYNVRTFVFRLFAPFPSITDRLPVMPNDPVTSADPV